MERKIDELGRVVLPIEMREKLNLSPMDKIYIHAANNEITIRKAIDSCIFCNCAVDLVRYGNHEICVYCIDRLKDTKVGDVLYGVKCD